MAYGPWVRRVSSWIYKVIVKTDEREYVVRHFKGIAPIQMPKDDAHALKDAIMKIITDLREAQA